MLILPGLRDFGGAPVGEALMRSVVVGVDVGADDGSGFVEGLELLAPDAALLELPNQLSMKAWLSGSR